MNNLRILLIQLRDDLYTKQDEFLRFLVVGGLRPAQMVAWDTFANPHFDIKKIRDFDAVFIGGSSNDPDHEVYFTQEKYAFTSYVLDAIKLMADEQIPLLASCMGFHMVHQALGGEIIIDIDNKESGTYKMTLNEEGKKDPLFNGLPDSFPVVSYHKKRAMKIPPGMVNLGSTEKCPYQAVRIPNRPFYATQFHPELNAETVVRWAERYKEKYHLSDRDIEIMRNDLTDTTEANQLVKKFLRECFPEEII